jgi:hypothetical protein
MKKMRTRQEILDKREADDKRRGTCQPKHKSLLTAGDYTPPGIVLVTNPFRVPVRRRPTIILPGRGSAAAAPGGA